MNHQEQQHVLRRLAPLAEKSNGALRERVYVEGKCLGQYTPPPTPAHEEVDPFFPPAHSTTASRRLRERRRAAHACAGCPVRPECLELELRVGGRDSAGTWGGTCEQDRHELYSAWFAERDAAESDVARAV